MRMVLYSVVVLVSALVVVLRVPEVYAAMLEPQRWSIVEVAQAIMKGDWL